MAPRLNGTTTRVRVSGPCAVAHLPAAERRLMVTPPSAKKGRKFWREMPFYLIFE